MTRFRSLLTSFVVLVLIGLSVALFIRLNIDSVATRYVQDRLSNCFSGSEFTATIDRAVFMRGEGFELRGLRLFDVSGSRSNTTPPLLEIESVFLSIPISQEDIVELSLHPTEVELRRAKVHFSESDLTNGTLFRLAGLLQRLRTDQKLIPVRIRNSIIEYAGQHNDAELERVARLTDVEVSLGPAAGQSNVMHASIAANGNHIHRVAAQVLLDSDSGQWRLKLDQFAATLNDELMSMLSIPARLKQFDGCNFSGMQGQLDVTGTAAGNLKTQPIPGFRFEGSVSDFSIRNDTVPGPLSNCQASFSIDNTGLRIKRAVGQLGTGTFDVAWRQQGFPQPLDWQVSGSMQNMEWDHQTLKFLPAFCNKFCADFSPAGRFDTQFRFDSVGRKEITCQLKDISFSWYRFPFQASHCVGNVRWLDNDLEFHVRCLDQQQLLEIDGKVANPGEGATYVVNFGTEGRLPIDAKLLNALRNFPSIDKGFRDFRPVGTVSGHGSVKKLAPGAEAAQTDVHVRLHDCSVRHRSFDYPMHSVNGTILVTHEGMTFEEINGLNSSGQALCNGLWNRRDGLQLSFIFNSVQLNDQLRSALPPKLRELWDGMRPGGHVKLGRAFLTCPPGDGGVDVRIQANLGEPGMPPNPHAVHIHPRWFPWRIEQLRGDIEIGGGKITLDRIEGKHGKTWLSCAGSGSYSSDSWSVRLENLLAGSVRLDEELLRAFPGDLSRAIENLDFQGQLNVSGGITFSGDYLSRPTADQLEPPRIQQVLFESDADATLEPIATESNATEPGAKELGATVDWDLRMDFDQASIRAGLLLEDMFGFVSLAGSWNGRVAQCHGDIALESLTVNDTQIRKVKGPIWIDQQQTLVGKFVKSTVSEPQSLVGEAFKGQLVLDGWVAHQDSWPFFIQATIENSALEEAAAELAPQWSELSGDGFGYLRLRGNASDLHSFAGSGNIHLQNAKIHELPVILSLLKILSIKEVTRTAFDTSDVDFTINGDQIKLDRIELIGDAISLIGNGYLELKRYADINFYSVVGRNRLYIPLVSELYLAGSQRIMWINIAGPLDNLATTRRVLPGLNDSIRTLFQAGGDSPGQETFTDRTANLNQ